MLVITRKIGERVRLELPDGRHVWVMVCDASLVGGSLRLGIDAPRDVEIVREELLREGERRG